MDLQFSSVQKYKPLDEVLRNHDYSVDLYTNMHNSVISDMVRVIGGLLNVFHFGIVLNPNRMNLLSLVYFGDDPKHVVCSNVGREVSRTFAFREDARVFSESEYLEVRSGINNMGTPLEKEIFGYVPITIGIKKHLVVAEVKVSRNSRGSGRFIGFKLSNLGSVKSVEEHESEHEDLLGNEFVDMYHDYLSGIDLLLGR